MQMQKSLFRWPLSVAFVGGLGMAPLSLAGHLALQVTPQPSPTAPAAVRLLLSPPQGRGPRGDQGDSVLQRSVWPRACDGSLRSKLTPDKNSFCQLWESWCHL